MGKIVSYRVPPRTYVPDYPVLPPPKHYDKDYPWTPFYPSKNYADWYYFVDDNPLYGARLKKPIQRPPKTCHASAPILNSLTYQERFHAPSPTPVAPVYGDKASRGGERYVPLADTTSLFSSTLIRLSPDSHEGRGFKGVGMYDFTFLLIVFTLYLASKLSFFVHKR